MPIFCYFNGKITTLNKVKISPYDLGLLRGYGIFDVLKTENGKIFCFAQHWKKLNGYAKELDLKIPVKKEEYLKILEKLLKLNKFEKSTIRVVLTGGESQNGFTRMKNKETFFVLVEKFHGPNIEDYEKGVSMIILEYERFFPKAKVANHVVAIRNQEKKEKAGAFEILYLKNGKVLEASTSNFFLVKNGKIITPKENVLLGKTMGLVIKLAKKNKIPVEEREISEKELWEAQEAFLTATSKGVLPVVKIDKKKIGDGKVGKVTKLLMEKLQEFVKRY